MTYSKPKIGMIVAYSIVLIISAYSFSTTIETGIQLSKTTTIKTYYHDHSGGATLVGDDIGFCQSEDNCLSLIEILQSRAQTSGMLSLVLIGVAIFGLVITLKK